MIRYKSCRFQKEKNISKKVVDNEYRKMLLYKSRRKRKATK